MTGRGVNLPLRLHQIQVELRLPGAVAAAATRDAVEWVGAVGSSRADTRLQTDTLFPTASLVKPLAAVVVLQLVDEGLLALDEAVADIVSVGNRPIVRAARARPEIKVRHLLTHTSGLRLVPLGPRRYRAEPGAEFRYNGNAFGVLTDVVEQVTGRPFGEILQERILDVCGMTRTRPGVATDYDGSDTQVAAPMGRKGLLGRLLPPRPGVTAASGLVGTAVDYCRFSAALCAGELVDARALAAAWTPATTARSQSAPYGLGFFLDGDGEDQVVWHTGNLPGRFSALWVLAPRTHRSIVLLANVDRLTRTIRPPARSLRAHSAGRLALDWVENGP